VIRGGFKHFNDLPENQNGVNNEPGLDKQGVAQMVSSILGNRLAAKQHPHPQAHYS